MTDPSAGAFALVFTYGSLMRGLHNHHHLGQTSTTFLAATTTAKPMVMFDSGAGFPYTVDPTSLPADIAALAVPIPGEVYRVSQETLTKSLDRLESHPSWYRRELVAVSDSVKKGEEKKGQHTANTKPAGNREDGEDSTTTTSNDLENNEKNVWMYLMPFSELGEQQVRQLKMIPGGDWAKYVRDQKGL